MTLNKLSHTKFYQYFNHARHASVVCCRQSLNSGLKAWCRPKGYAGIFFVHTNVLHLLAIIFNKKNVIGCKTFLLTKVFGLIECNQM